MATATADWVGLTLDGRYTVTAKLGEGGMGFVYRAKDARLDCDVVIKVPRAAMLEEAGFRERFKAEVGALVRLAHPHVVKVTDFGQHDGVPFAVMQFLPGGSLDDRRPKDAAGHAKAVASRSLGEWLLPVAEALDFVHKQGYIHRDIKPANILFDAYKNAYISDFGVAKVVAGGKAASAGITGDGKVLGTPSYMAPEMVMGEPFDGKIDQYALAVTVYELLAGRPPFLGSTAMAVLVQRTTEEAPPLVTVRPGTIPELSAVLAKALSKDPAERYPTCAAFAQAVLSASRDRASASRERERLEDGKKANPSFAHTAGSPKVETPRQVATRTPSPVYGVVGPTVRPHWERPPGEKQAALVPTVERQLKPRPPAAAGSKKTLIIALASGGVFFTVTLAVIAVMAIRGAGSNASRERERTDGHPPVESADVAPRERPRQPGRPARPEPPVDVADPPVAANVPPKPPPITPPADNRRGFEVNLTSPAEITLVPGQEKKVEFTVDRSGGYDGRLTVTVPASAAVQASTVTIPAFDKSAKVRIAAAASPQPGVHTVHITVATADGSVSRDLPLAVHIPPIVEKLTFEGHTGTVTCVSLSPDGSLALSGGADGTVRVWDSATGKEKWNSEGHSGGTRSVAFSPGAQWAVSGGADGKVRFFDVATGKVTPCNIHHESAVWQVHFEDAQHAHSVSRDQTIHWVAATGKPRQVPFGRRDATLGQRFKDDITAGAEPTAATRFPCDSGEFLVSGLTGRMVTVFSRAAAPTVEPRTPSRPGTRTKTPPRPAAPERPDIVRPIAHTPALSSPAKLVAISDDGTRLLTIGEGNDLTVWETPGAGATAPHEARPVPGFPCPLDFDVSCAALDATGRLMLLGGPNGVLKLWRVP
jgi:serine/threonine protein kinase